MGTGPWGATPNRGRRPAWPATSTTIRSLFRAASAGASCSGVPAWRASPCRRSPRCWPPAARARETDVGGSSPSASGGGSNQFGTGGVAGAPYPLARPEAPVTWTIQDGNKPIASGMQPESGATVQVLRWPYYLDDGVREGLPEEVRLQGPDHRVHRHGQGPAEDRLRPGALRHALRDERVGGRTLDRRGAAAPVQPRLRAQPRGERVGLVPEPVLRRGLAVHPSVLGVVDGHLLAQRQVEHRPGDHDQPVRRLLGQPAEGQDRAPRQRAGRAGDAHVPRRDEGRERHRPGDDHEGQGRRSRRSRRRRAGSATTTSTTPTSRPARPVCTSRGRATSATPWSSCPT